MMKPTDVIRLRGKLQITQITLAGRLGMSLRAIQNLESGKARLRRMHELAIRSMVLDYAIDRRDPSLLGPLRTDIATMMMGETALNLGD